MTVFLLFRPNFFMLVSVCVHSCILRISVNENPSFSSNRVFSMLTMEMDIPRYSTLN